MFNSSCMSFSLQAFPPCWTGYKATEVRRREDTDREIEYGERHKSGYRKGFSGDMHKYKVLESAV